MDKKHTYIILAHLSFLFICSLLVLMGIGFGALIDFVEPSVFPEFGPDLFFHWLLPPIILEAAYSLYHRAFLDNLRTILLFAVVVSDGCGMNTTSAPSSSLLLW